MAEVDIEVMEVFLSEIAVIAIIKAILFIMMGATMGTTTPLGIPFIQIRLPPGIVFVSMRNSSKRWTIDTKLRMTKETREFVIQTGTVIIVNTLVKK